LIHELYLSPHQKCGISCGADGAFVRDIPLLDRVRQDKGDAWEPRDCHELSKQLSEQYCLPIDMSAKTGGLKAIANAFNEGDLPRAQIATVLLGIPDPPRLSKYAPSRDQTIKLVRDLHWSGMLKWDPDEHPRWPAGSSDGRGGEFAPKGEGGETDTSQSSPPDAGRPYDSERHARSRGARDQLADAGMSDAFDDSVAEAARAAAQIHSDGTRPVYSDDTNPHTEDSGIYENYGYHIGGVQLAGLTIPMGSLGAARANPVDWANLTRLADGALELGPGQIITAAALLAAVDQSRERDAVRSAMVNFQLNPSQAADVLPARAYVWANTAAPWNFRGVPTSGAQLESVSKSIMLLELARPGTLNLGLQGDRLSTSYLNMAAQEGLSDTAILESRIRPVNAPAALQSTSTAARAALKLKPNDNMRAHHLVPVNVIAKNMDLATLASKAGWLTDSPENLIALPGDPQTQRDLAATGKVLPMQVSAHPIYDGQTQKQIDTLKLLLGSPLTPVKARSILDTVAIENRRQITAGAWQPMLKSPQI